MFNDTERLKNLGKADRAADKVDTPAGSDKHQIARVIDLDLETLAFAGSAPLRVMPDTITGVLEKVCKLG